MIINKSNSYHDSEDFVPPEEWGKVDAVFRPDSLGNLVNSRSFNFLSYSINFGQISSNSPIGGGDSKATCLISLRGLDKTFGCASVDVGIRDWYNKKISLIFHIINK